MVMWTYHSQLLTAPVPRYTSYPTAAEFADGAFEDDLVQALETAQGDISLYVHIPFCEKICWYCGCNTAAANRAGRVESYLDALHREIALVARHLPSGARVTRIAFGGGSPNGIAAIDFVRLMDALTLHFALGSQSFTRPAISVELDPRSLHREWAEVIAAVGVTHASLGVQTFADDLQRAIGRVQSPDLIAASTRLLRESGVTSLNFDLMYGLPGQELGQLEDSLVRSVALGADRIALFGYAHVPHLIARQRRIDASALPGPRMRFDMAVFGHRFLTDAGYEPVGFDHFAKPADALAKAARDGHLRRNFQGFTDDQAPVLIGLGASAIHSFPGVLVQNEKNTGRYRMMLSQGRLPGTRGVRRSVQDRRRGAIIEALLCQGRARIDADLRIETCATLRPFVDAGVCRYEGEELVIAPEGRPYARGIAARFDSFRQGSLGHFSAAV